jgi:predicted dehydrogenase
VQILRPPRKWVKVKLKVGVIGAGHQGVIHVERYLALRDTVQVVAICDPDRNAVDSVARKYGVENKYSDYQKLLEDDIDAVSVCAPNYLHKPMAVAAAEAGKHILLEKPIALTLDDADEIISAVQKRDVMLMVAFNQLFTPMVQKARSLIDSGKLGKLAIGNVERYANYSQTSRSDFGWRSDNERVGGGSLIESGIHKISILYYLLGGVDSVVALSKKLTMDIDGEDNIKLLATHRSGAIGSVTSSWTSEIRGPEQDRISIYGDKGSVIAYGSFNKGTGHLELSDASVDEYNRTHYWFPQTGTSRDKYRSARKVYDTYQNEIGHFVDCVLNDKTPMVTGHDARAIQEIAIAAYESVEKQSVITLPLKH